MPATEMAWRASQKALRARRDHLARKAFCVARKAKSLAVGVAGLAHKANRFARQRMTGVAPAQGLPISTPRGTPRVQPGKMIPASYGIGGMCMGSVTRGVGLPAVAACRTWRAVATAGGTVPAVLHGAADQLPDPWR